jgi:uncharacterized membrane protein
VKRSPNLALAIFLYTVGILLVMMAFVLFVQAVGWFQIPQPAIMSLVLLAIGLGILMGLKNR